MVLYSREKAYQQSTRGEHSGREQVAEHLSIAVAVDLLDWLEVHGIHPGTVRIDPEGRMTVRWTSQ